MTTPTDVTYTASTTVISSAHMNGLNDWVYGAYGLLGETFTSANFRAALGSAASGANSDITSLAVLASINGGQIAGTRRKSINGDFSVNQLAVSGTVTLAAGVYGHDGWKAGAGGCTYTFSTVANVTTVTISAGTLLQVLDGHFLQSGTHTLSWGGTAQGRWGTGSYAASGVQGTVVGGTNINIEFGTGTLRFVQAEFGTIATSFEFLMHEMQLCQRYYYLFYISSDWITNGYSSHGVAYPVPMAAVPTKSVVTIEAQANIAAIVFDANVTSTNVGTTVQFSSTTTANRAYCFALCSVAARL